MRNTSRPYTGLRLITGVGLISTLLLLTACASVPEAPHSALKEAQVAITNAQKADASRYANPDLTDARDKLAQANAAVTAEDMIMADRLAREARIAAELALARTEATKAKDVNEELIKGIDALNDEMSRAGEKS
ncbi:MAG: DUF4398 domain-containing protein [Xanthomonadales bacterium]|nr:DUF4398 domain-containing protein [Xanthomonadales bacterium]